MPRRARKVLHVGKRVQVVILPPRRRPSRWKRFHRFVYVHQKSIGVLAVLLVATVLVLVHKHQLAAVTVAGVLEKAIEVFLAVMTDRVFPGGEFVREV
jgi:hypothetical protein